MTNPMHAAVRDIENLLQRRQQTLHQVRPPAWPPLKPATHFPAWMDSGAPVFIAVTTAALLALAIGLTSAAFAFIPVTTAADTIIVKSDPLSAPASAKITDRGYGRLKDRFCQAAFNGVTSIADRVEDSNPRHGTEDAPQAATPAPSSDSRSDTRRKYEAANRTRHRASSSTQGRTRRQPSLIERFTGVRL